MPERVQPIYTDNPGALPAEFTLPPGLDLEVSSIRARVNGAAAGASFIVVCETLTNDGRIMAQARIDQEFAAADTGALTWAPFLRRQTPGAAPPAASQGEWATLVKTVAQSIPAGGAAFLTWDDFYTSSTAIFGTTLGSTTPPFNNTAGDNMVVAVAGARSGIFLTTCDVQWEDLGAAYAHQVDTAKANLIGAELGNFGASEATWSQTDEPASGNPIDVGDVSMAGKNAATFNPNWRIQAINGAAAAANVTAASLTVIYIPCSYTTGPQVY